MDDLRPEQLPGHAQRLEQARRRAQWELGDSSWADMIVDVYCAPRSDMEQLQKDMQE